MMFPLVADLADDGIAVTVTCRTLGLCRAQYYRWRTEPFTDAELDEAWLANAIFDAHRDDPEFGCRLVADEVRAGGLGGVGSHGVADLFGQRLVVRLRQAQGLSQGPGGRHRSPRRPGATRLHRRGPRRAVAVGHHRAPHRRGQGLPLRHQRRLFEPDRRLGHRLEDEGPPRRFGNRHGRGSSRR